MINKLVCNLYLLKLLEDCMVYKLWGIEDGLNVLVDTEDEWGAQVPQSQQAENASTKGDVETESKKEKGKGCVHGSLQATDMSVNVLCLCLSTSLSNVY